MESKVLPENEMGIYFEREFLLDFKMVITTICYYHKKKNKVYYDKLKVLKQFSFMNNNLPQNLTKCI